MLASKENARHALAYFKEVAEGKPLLIQRQNFITEFLTAAEKKLPSENAYRRDAQRKRAAALAK